MGSNQNKSNFVLGERAEGRVAITSDARIIKEIDEKTAQKTALEDALRNL